MTTFTIYQWNTIQAYLKECMKNNSKCAHCARYNKKRNECMYAKQCFINNMAMYSEPEEEKSTEED